MVNLRDDLWIAVDALSAHKLRAVLTVLGLTMGVATLMTVMTLVQGANLYVEQKIANLGTNVFRLAKTPFAVVDFTVVVKALKNKNIDISDYRAVAELCNACEQVGASASGTLSVQYQNKQTDDTVDHRLHAQHGRHRHAHARPRAATSRPAKIATRRMSASSARRWWISSFPHDNPIGRNIRTGSLEFTVIGTFQKLGSVLGQDQDNFVIIPLTTYLKVRGTAHQPDARNQSVGRREEFRRRAGRGARHHALAPPRPARQGRQLSSSAPRKATSRSGRASADRSSRYS